MKTYSLSSLVVAFGLLLFPYDAFAQGCPPARLMCPLLGSQDRTYLEPRESLIGISYRHYQAFRDYQGGKALPVPSPPELYARTRVNIFDLNLTHAFTRKFSLTLELPLAWASRETYGEHDGTSPHTMRAHGLGDARVVGSFWLFDPDTHMNGNVSARFGVKTPFGEHDAQDYSIRAAGPVLRPVDPAIQPGTGGWGIVFGANGFRRIQQDTFIYLDGTYLSNPLEMNGTESVFGDRPEITLGDIGYIIDSVPDQYVGRIGVSYAIRRLRGLSATFGVRTDGLPSHDLIGGSDGFRIPGYTVSVEPGFSFSRGRSFFSLTVPLAVKGHGSRAVADERIGSPFVGIATLADSQLTISYSYRF